MPEARHCLRCGAALRPVPDGRDAGRPGCPACGWIHFENPAPTVMGLLRREDGALLVLERAIEPYRGGHDLPGGFVEPDEHPEDALRREVREETGIVLDGPLRLLGAWASRYGGPEGKPLVDLAFTGRVPGAPRVRLSAEGSGAGWYPLDAVPPLCFASERRALAALRAGG